MSEPVSFDMRLVVPDHVGIRDVDGELVLLNFESETYHGLDAVGSRMLEVMRAAPSVEVGVGELLDEFEVDEARLRSDLEELIQHLLDDGLVELHEH